MFLPSVEDAYIPEAKLRDYLLNENHPIGAAKAQFLGRLGYDHTNTAVLQDALLDLVRSSHIVTLTNTPFGTNYRVDGLLANPKDRTIEVTTIWHLERDGTRPRLLTLYPKR